MGSGSRLSLVASGLALINGELPRVSGPVHSRLALPPVSALNAISDRASSSPSTTTFAAGRPGMFTSSTMFLSVVFSFLVPLVTALVPAAAHAAANGDFAGLIDIGGASGRAAALGAHRRCHARTTAVVWYSAGPPCPWPRRR